MGIVITVLLAIVGIPIALGILVLSVISFISFIGALADAVPLFLKTFAKLFKEFLSAIKENFER